MVPAGVREHTQAPVRRSGRRADQRPVAAAVGGTGERGRAGQARVTSSRVKQQRPCVAWVAYIKASEDPAVRTLPEGLPVVARVVTLEHGAAVRDPPAASLGVPYHGEGETRMRERRWHGPRRRLSRIDVAALQNIRSLVGALGDGRRNQYARRGVIGRRRALEEDPERRAPAGRRRR